MKWVVGMDYGRGVEQNELGTVLKVNADLSDVVVTL